MYLVTFKSKQAQSLNYPFYSRAIPLKGVSEAIALTAFTLMCDSIQRWLINSPQECELRRDLQSDRELTRFESEVWRTAFHHPPVIPTQYMVLVNLPGLKSGVI